MSINRIEYGETAREYAKYRRADRAAVERLIAGSGIAGTSRVLEVGCGTGKLRIGDSSTGRFANEAKPFLLRRSVFTCHTERRR